MSEAPKTYFWTQQKPDRPGWWWMKKTNGIPVVTYLDGSHALFSFGHAGSGTTEPTRLPEDAEWCGPIPEPSEPPEHPLVQELRGIAIRQSPEWRTSVIKIADKIQAVLSIK